MASCSQMRVVMTERNLYDVAVVGAGMIGCAAARHLAETLSLKVLLVGPNEPKNRENTEIFGSHHDEGRDTSRLHPDPVYGLLAARSIDRYRDIETRSGIDFYSEVGFLAVGPKSCQTIEDVSRNARESHTANLRWTSKELSQEMPFFRFPDDSECLFTGSNSGHISPRNLVKAEKTLAVKSGCDVVDDVVKQLVSVKSPTKCVDIVTDGNQVFRANKVLLATGAFTSSRQLIPRELTPKLRILTETVTKLRVSENEAKRLSRMPSLITYDGVGDNMGYYVLPPIRYPNGCYYLKIGHGKTVSETLTSPDRLTQWQRGYGDPTIATNMHKVLVSFLPDLKVDGVEMDSCLTSHTESGYPYIDMLTDSIGVAIGGNGRGAKSCDEIGRLAALMIMKGEWAADDIDRECFRYRFTGQNPGEFVMKHRL